MSPRKLRAAWLSVWVKGYAIDSNGLIDKSPETKTKLSQATLQQALKTNMAADQHMESLQLRQPVWVTHFSVVVKRQTMPKKTSWGWYQRHCGKLHLKSTGRSSSTTKSTTNSYTSPSYGKKRAKKKMITIFIAESHYSSYASYFQLFHFDLQELWWNGVLHKLILF